MQTGHFSRTAITTAALRCAHQFVDGARIFADPLAQYVLAAEDAEALRNAAQPVARPLRLFVALRSRIAEDAALASGVRDIVVLGAGLDTFSHRAPETPGGTIYEIDHPATQAEKRRRLARNGLAAPAHLVYSPCDFERDTLAETLSAAGLGATPPAAFLWLGVVPYLTRDMVVDTLRFIAARPGGAHVVFDYSNPLDSDDAGPLRQYREEMAARVARIGEPFRCYFDTPELHRLLDEIGFDAADDWGPQRIAERLGAPLRPHDFGGHILHAWKR